jgi:hypothetical protein
MCVQARTTSPSLFCTRARHLSLGAAVRGREVPRVLVGRRGFSIGDSVPPILQEMVHGVVFGGIGMVGSQVLEDDNEDEKVEVAVFVVGHVG